MKKFFTLILLACLVLSWTGCGSSKDIPYLKGSEYFTLDDYEAHEKLPLYDARIMPKDVLTITVATTDPEAALPFNLVVPNKASGTSTTSQQALQSYIVDNDGKIDFPVLGMVELKGFTKREAELKIKELMKHFLKEVPVVTVNFVNYKISVLGEVASPNMFTVTNEKVNIFEALAMAGDMTIWGRRDNVKIIREDERGVKYVILMNLNDRDVIFSPNFYLQQNDIVYVEPNATKAKNSGIGNATSLWVSGASILISVAGLIINVINISR